MFSPCPDNNRLRDALLGLVLCGLGLAFEGAAAAADTLRVCADPNNLPFSNRRGEGLENTLAEFVAEALGRSGVTYTWHPQRRGFARHTLRAKTCDLIMGVPAEYELARPTLPYYRSTYVFVYRRDATFSIESLDDPKLRKLRIGVHVVGDDYSNTPGAEALGRRGIIDNLVGYSIYGDYGKPHPPSRLIEAVAGGEIDVAIAWGPLAGYFAPRQPAELRLTPVKPRVDQGSIPLTFDISMAVRHEDTELHRQLNELIRERGAEIRALLQRYGVPYLEPTKQTAERTR